MKFSVVFIFLLSILQLNAQISFTNASSMLNSNFSSYHATAAADMNDDGRDDLVRISDQGDLYVLYQQDTGMGFDENAWGNIYPGQSDLRTWGLAVADFNGDGWNDIAVGGKYNEMKIILSASNGSGYEMDIAEGDQIFVQGVNCFDINNDGLNDIFACHDDGISKILINNGDGTFTPSTDYLYPETDSPSDNSGNYGSLFSDLDNNGHCDLYISKCRQGVGNPTDPRRINLLFLNDGNGGWTSGGEEAGIDVNWQSWSADAGDVDNDGDMDLFITNHDHGAQLFENDGEGYFNEITESAQLEDAYTYTPYQSSFEDFNNDGFIDLLVTGGSHNTFCLNNGDGTFDCTEDIIDYFTNSHALGDLNNDGFIDVFAIQGGYGAEGFESQDDQLFMNNANDNNYIKIKLEGTLSNYNGVGSRVEIQGEWGLQIRDVKSGLSYGIANSLFANFGIGSSDSVDNVIVTWPSGIKEEFGSFTANEHLVLVEGTGTSIVSTRELTDQIDLLIYPNPSSDEINIRFQGSTEVFNQALIVRLIDGRGSQVFSGRFNDTRIALDISEVASGSYYLEFLSNSKTIAIEKLIID